MSHTKSTNEWVMKKDKNNQNPKPNEMSSHSAKGAREKRDYVQEESVNDQEKSTKSRMTSFESLHHAALYWPRSVWVAVLTGFLILTWIIATIWQWVMIAILLLIFAVVMSWVVMMWRRARLEADGWTKAEAYRAYIKEEKSLDRDTAQDQHVANEQEADDETTKAKDSCSRKMCARCGQAFSLLQDQAAMCCAACIES